jgi:hypothetical protein
MKPNSDPTAIEDDGTPSRILHSTFSGKELRRNKLKGKGKLKLSPCLTN